MTTKPIEVFISYAGEDENLREQLDIHLANLRRQHVVETWHDRKILPGKEWSGEIDKHLESADVILFLLSPDFMNSDYCNDVEVKRAIERHKKGEARVIPVILRPTDWEGSFFSSLQALPDRAKPIVEWQNPDAAFVDVVRGIRRTIADFITQKKAPLAATTFTTQEINTEHKQEVHVDLSGKIDSPLEATVVAISNGKKGSISISAVVKQKILAELAIKYKRSSSVRRQAYFLSLILFFLLRDEISSYDQITVDDEYPGHAKEVKQNLLQHFQKNGVKVKANKIVFAGLTKSPAYKVAHRILRLKELPNLNLRASEAILELNKK